MAGSSSDTASDTSNDSERRPTVREELVRDLGGALLFGVPLIYTMEVWWLGQTSSTETLGVMTLVGAAVAGILRYSVIGRLGFPGAMLAGARCAAMSIVVALVIAYAIGVLAYDDGAAKWVGTGAALGIPLAFGAALGSVLFSNAASRDGDEDPDSEGGGSGDDDGSGDDTSLGRDIAASGLGALFISLPIAPTGEVPLIASMLDPVRVLLVVPLALLVCWVILFATGFLAHRGRSRGISVGRSLSATCATAGVGLLVTVALLYGFGAVDSATPTEWVVRHVAALLLPSVIGAAAGRLAAA